MKHRLISLVLDDHGQDLIEYGLLVGVITVASITAIVSIGTKVTAFFTSLDTNLNAAS